MWTATKVDKGQEGPSAWVSVEYTDGTAKFLRSYTTESVSAGWPDFDVRAQLVRLNALDLSAVKLGAIDPPRLPDPPTQDELDLQAWIAAKLDYQTKQKIFDSGLSKTVTQQDVDDAYAQMKTLYKEEYGVFL
jgi:hypothetical protein